MIFNLHNKQRGAEDVMRCYDIFSACRAWHVVVVEYIDLLLPFPSPHVSSFFRFFFPFFFFLLFNGSFNNIEKIISDLKNSRIEFKRM